MVDAWSRDWPIVITLVYIEKGLVKIESEDTSFSRLTIILLVPLLSLWLSRALCVCMCLVWYGMVWYGMVCYGMRDDNDGGPVVV